MYHVAAGTGFAGTDYAESDGIIVDIMGKQGKYFPEFKYKIQDICGDLHEIWEGEICAK